MICFSFQIDLDRSLKTSALQKHGSTVGRSCSIGMRMTIWDIENEEEKVALKATAIQAQ